MQEATTPLEGRDWDYYSLEVWPALLCLGPRSLKRGAACLAFAPLKRKDEANPARVRDTANWIPMPLPG